MTTARLDLRLDERDKARIERAARVRGVAVSSFVRDAVLREAAHVMSTEQDESLSEAETKRYLKALDAPFRPNVRLRKALRRVTSKR